MGERTKCLATAMSVTVLDGAVATYYSGGVWRAFSVVIWSKVLFLFLAAMWAITLLHIWAHACSHLRRAIQGNTVVASIAASRLPAEFAEETDV